MDLTFNTERRGLKMAVKTEDKGEKVVTALDVREALESWGFAVQQLLWQGIPMGSCPLFICALYCWLF